MNIKTRSKTAPAILAGNIARIERSEIEPLDDGRIIHDRVVSIANGRGELVAGNATLLEETYLSQPLNAYALGWRDGDIEAEVDLWCPAVEVPRRFDFRTFTNIEEWFSETDDDARPMGGDFKGTEYTAGESSDKTLNRGLKMVVDLDQINSESAWKEKRVAKLIRRLLRNKVRRSAALIDAASTNSAKTWGSSANPDSDMRLDLKTGADASGIRANRVILGEAAWDLRLSAFEAQTTAGAFSGAQRDLARLAQYLMVDRVGVSKARYQSSASAKTGIAGSKVYFFTATDGADTEDPANIKDFWTPCQNGQRFCVYERQVGSKLWEIAVEHYELLKIVSTLGMRKFTVS